MEFDLLKCVPIDSAMGFFGSSEQLSHIPSGKKFKIWSGYCHPQSMCFALKSEFTDELLDSLGDETYDGISHHYVKDPTGKTIELVGYCCLYGSDDGESSWEEE